MTDELIDSSGYPPDWDSLVKKVKDDKGMLTVSNAIPAIRKAIKAKADFAGTKQTQGELLYNRARQRFPTYRRLLEAIE